MENLTIIMPVYNAERYISESIESIVNQKCDMSRIELILINDGSRDSSDVICRDYAEKYSWIRYVAQDNAGANAARLVGVELATSSRIMFIDADDIIEAGMLAAYFEVLDKYSPEFIVASAQYFGAISGKMPINIPYGMYEKDSYQDFFLTNVMFRGLPEDWAFPPGICSKVFIKNILLKYMNEVPKNIFYGEDVAIWFPYLLETKSAYVMDNYDYLYRVHSTSVSNTKNRLIYENNVSIFEYFCECIKGNKHESILYDQVEIYELLLMEHALKKNYGFKRSILEALQIANERLEKEAPRKRNVWMIDYTLLLNKKIIIYGAGIVGQSIIAQLYNISGVEVVAWTDKVSVATSRTVPREEALNSIYDLLVIAVLKENVAAEIELELVSMGVPKEKIMWVEPVRIQGAYWLEQSVIDGAKK